MMYIYIYIMVINGSYDIHIYICIYICIYRYIYIYMHAYVCIYMVSNTHHNIYGMVWLSMVHDISDRFIDDNRYGFQSLMISLTLWH